MKFLLKWPLWLLIASCALGTGASFADATGGQAPSGRRVLGGRPDFTWQQLPAGEFRNQIGALKPEARQRAEERLRELRLPADDVGFLRVDPEGGIYYADSFPLPPEAPADSSGGGPEVHGSVPVSPFPSHLLFHSKPGAAHVMYLDFDGESVTGTGWNVGLRDPIPAVAFSTDGDVNNFSDSEQAGIRDMWQRVSEDYAPYNIDVTTERPAVFNNQTCHALITRHTDANGNPNPSSTAGGVAYINVHGSYSGGYYRPAWIYDTWNAETPSYIAETISHETGHNMGLYHDGPGYHTGHGSGDTSWAPIMGSSWAKNVTQWCRGEYYGANNGEDDLAIIAGKLGYRTDDHGDTLGGATDLVIDTGGGIASTTPETDPTNSDPDNKGIIEDDDDVDLFTFLAGAGEVQLTVNPWKNPSSYRGGNLDVLIELLDSSGSVLETADPTSTTYASLTTTVTGGRYYLRITGTGWGDPLSSSPSGYTGYGSIGQYFISGQVVETVLQLTNEGGATNVTLDTATLQGYLVDTGGAATVVSVYWGTSNAGESGWDTNMTVGPRGVGPLSQTVSGLTPNTHYYYRFYGTHGATGEWAAPSAEFVTAGTVPFSETFDTLTPGNVHGQHGWEVAGTDEEGFGAALVQSDPTYGGSAQACSVSNAELTHAFSGPGAASTVVWTDLYVVPEPASSPGVIPSNSTGKAIFLVDADTGALAAMDGDTLVLFTNKPSVPEGEWVHFTTRMDYGSKTWHLWLNSTTVVYNLAFHATNTPGLSRLTILDRFSTQATYVDNVTISLDRPDHILTLDSDADALDDDWERDHFTSLEVSDGGPDDDWDGDSFPDLYEFLANTDPTDTNSLLVISNAWPGATDEFVLEWQSASNRTYSVERSTNLLVVDWAALVSNLPATPPLNRHTVDVDNAGSFYRITLDQD